uniref:COMM domain-containing protein n=1 Tax=Phaeocystis antarctica TaxID=33657 RepID=A0A7S0ND34_9EUKA|mmetsp:Transcript_39056/g.91801  ORF Transcript_39056/g.91801 Transcript_39056/m.91801 type:complete len:211 (+) Transcript_39056:84-716(+)
MPVAAAPPSTALNEHLQFLSSLPAEYIAEFCKAALALLQQKAQGKMFSNAAKQLGIEREAVEQGVQALCYVLLRAASTRTPAEQVLDGIELQLQPDALAALQSFYTEAVADLAQVSSRGPDLPAYHSLEWRLQVQVAGRHVVAGDLQPSYLLRLHTEDPRGFGAPRAEHLLQADFANLRHLATELDAALREETSTHSRRIARRVATLRDA